MELVCVCVFVSVAAMLLKVKTSVHLASYAVSENIFLLL